MAHHITYYWKNQTFKAFKKFEGLIDAWESSDRFAGSRIAKGDYLYSVTNLNGEMYLIAGLKVKDIISDEDFRKMCHDTLAGLFKATHHLSV